MPQEREILFVCTGNTCRSPLAEGLFRLAAAGRDDLRVGSAGVAASAGDGASRDTLAVLKKRGGSLEGFASRPVTAALMERASHVLAMTHGHLAALRRRFPQHAHKCFLVCSFADPAVDDEVPDPIGMGRAAYEETAMVLEAAIPAIIARLEDG